MKLLLSVAVVAALCLAVLGDPKVTHKGACPLGRLAARRATARSHGRRLARGQAATLER
jgi:hypothetical protein